MRTQQFTYGEDLMAVTSISICIRASRRLAEIMVAAGLTVPKYLRSMGQHFWKSSPAGRM